MSYEPHWIVPPKKLKRFSIKKVGTDIIITPDPNGNLVMYEDAKPLEVFANDCDQYGLRHDMNPTHMFVDMMTSESFWHEYAASMERMLKERAKQAMEKLNAAT